MREDDRLNVTICRTNDEIGRDQVAGDRGGDGRLEPGVGAQPLADGAGAIRNRRAVRRERRSVRRLLRSVRPHQRMYVDEIHEHRQEQVRSERGDQGPTPT